MIVEILLLLSALTAFWYWKFQRYSDRWDKLGVKSPKGNSFPLGDNPLICKDVLLRRANISEVAIRQYREMDGVPYYGVNTVGKPALFINDPELLKQVTKVAKCFCGSPMITPSLSDPSERLPSLRRSQR